MVKRNKYAGHEALDPFFEVIQERLKGLVQPIPVMVLFM
jgi:hypothetical protein